ncbi:unnamed protein product [Linum tenue]|uniref:Uncharacterized protein n=1 Tax=Linum tenue TaxID=586396 RepID=A0AAV0PVY7_9ROSI|nr:unnamed protein product [Linum tenue]
MELLGFSTQKWLTAGGLGTLQIFTNFLSSAMIHATRPFVVNEWIQTKIEGYEVSGTVEVRVPPPGKKIKNLRDHNYFTACRVIIPSDGQSVISETWEKNY